MPVPTIIKGSVVIEGSSKGVRRIPPGVRHLVVRGCPNLTKLPKLPASLQTLTIYEVPLLTRIPAIPRRVGVLTLSDLPKLTSIGSMPSKQQWPADSYTRAIVARCALIKSTPLLKDLISITEEYLAPFHWTTTRVTEFLSAPLPPLQNRLAPPSLFSDYGRGDYKAFPIVID